MRSRTADGKPRVTAGMHIIAAVAEFERALVSERVKAGIAPARAQGKQWGGRPVKSFDVAEARRLRADGWSFAKIAAALDCNRNLLAQALREERKAE